MKFMLAVTALGITLAGCSLVPDAHSWGKGWRPLFDGRDLENWNQHGSARWRVENGIILGGQDGDAKRSGLLATKELFQDFELELEFMIDEHGKYNSGVYLRNTPGIAGRSGYQVNIGRPEAEEYIGLYTDRWLAKGDPEDRIRGSCIGTGSTSTRRVHTPRSGSTEIPSLIVSMPTRSRDSCSRAFSACRLTAPRVTPAGSSFATFACAN